MKPRSGVGVQPTAQAVGGQNRDWQALKGRKRTPLPSTSRETIRRGTNFWRNIDRFAHNSRPQDRVPIWPVPPPIRAPKCKLSPLPSILFPAPFSSMWKTRPQPRIKPVIARDTTCSVSLLTGTIYGSNFAIPRHKNSAPREWFGMDQR